jgi:YVTN family beta-propeller protein
VLPVGKAKGIQPGTYYILADTFAPYSGVTLTATYCTDPSKNTGCSGGGGGVVIIGGDPGINLSTTHVIADANGPAGMVTDGTHAFMLDNNGTVKIIDVSSVSDTNFNPPVFSPNSASVVGTVQVGLASGAGPHYGALGTVNGTQFLYTSNYFENTVSIVNVSDPTQPQTVDTFPVGGQPEGIAFADNKVYVTDISNNKLRVFDVTNASFPAEIGTGVSVGSWPIGVAISGSYAYVTNYSDATVSVVDISTPAAMNVSRTVSVGVNPSDVAVSGSYAYVANHAGSVSVMNISTPASASVVKTVIYPTGRVPNTISIAGNYAYTADLDSDTVTAVDITNPLLAYVYGSAYAQTGDYPDGVAAFGTNVYVAAYGWGFEIVDNSQ